MTDLPVLFDEWNVVRILGAGGFGIVQLMVHKQTGAKIAIKKCKWDSKQLTEIQKKRWTNEVEIMRCLKHPNIVKSIDLFMDVSCMASGADVNMPILCMEYCSKGDLRKVLNKTENCCGISEEEAICVMKDIVSAVEYLHSHSITHRDLKPENIVLQNECNKICYKLIDLGYAKELGEASTPASIVGTLNYVAPELLWKEKYSCSVDYWSLGILFYELATGTRPFLPRMQHTVTWMKHIKKKGYNDICAFESEGQIVFGQDILDPTHISRCLREKLVEWFKVVLQWDPKLRGKQLDENGIMQLVVFRLLRSILSKKIIYVFSVTSYKIQPYEVDDSTSIVDLQHFIERDTNISLNQQILTDYFGNVFTENEKPLLSQIQNPVLFVFKNGSMSMENIPEINFPKAVQKMIELPRTRLDFETIKDYYRVTIFFMKHEVYLFQLYIFALTIKVDLILARLNAFDENITNALENANTVLSELGMIKDKWDKETIEDKRKEALQRYIKKVIKLVGATDQIKTKFNSLIADGKVLKDVAKSLDCIDLSEPYNKAVTMYEEHMNEHPRKSAKPTEMVKMVFEFLKIREAHFQNQNILKVISQASKLEPELLILERIFDSVIVMTTAYREELQNITQCDLQSSDKNLSTVADNVDSLNTATDAPNLITNEVIPNSTKMETSCESTSNQGSVTTEKLDHKTIITKTDNVIYDSLVIRYTLDNLLAEMHTKYMDTVRLEP